MIELCLYWAVFSASPRIRLIRSTVCDFMCLNNRQKCLYRTHANTLCVCGDFSTIFQLGNSLTTSRWWWAHNGLRILWCDSGWNKWASNECITMKNSLFSPAIPSPLFHLEWLTEYAIQFPSMSVCVYGKMAFILFHLSIASINHLLTRIYIYYTWSRVIRQNWHLLVIWKCTHVPPSPTTCTFSTRSLSLVLGDTHRLYSFQLIRQMQYLEKMTNICVCAISKWLTPPYIPVGLKLGVDRCALDVALYIHTFAKIKGCRLPFNILPINSSLSHKYWLQTSHPMMLPSGANSFWHHSSLQRTCAAVKWLKLSGFNFGKFHFHRQ